ncbi:MULTISPECIES: acyltransferase [unclassified Mycolicibacterium]|uniref:acyltransferase family protein n=2 Tax=Mycolicibacterium TaxID=1866885 RepID=UPI001390D5B9|nr:MULTISPECIES: acyltransferase [unclassified Mycolicibacterium]
MTWQLGHRPQLDGIRAMAVIFVLIAHSELIPHTGLGGPVGVSVFFTLSGFLITTLLLEERQVYGSIKVGGFYKRRFLRLVPAMVTCVVLGLVTLLIHGYGFADWKLELGTLTYTANWVSMGGFPNLGPLGHMSPLGHTWSLAIEEQFYLIWPLVVTLTASVSKRRMVAVMGTLCALILVWRFVLFNGGASFSRIYFGTDTRADLLMYGALLAYLLHKSTPRQNVARWVVWVGLAIIGTTRLMTGAAKDCLLPTAVGIGTAVVIYAIAQNSGAGFFGWRWVRWIGKRSYGLYLYQLPVIVFFMLTVTTAKWIQFVALIATFVLAALSYKYIEMPFQRMKDRDKRSGRGLGESLGPAAGVT